MDINWTELIIGLLSGGTVIYLIVDKLFARKKDNAEAHGASVASFDKEMESLRKIRLDMIEDVNRMREQSKQELEKREQTISGTVESLKKYVEKLEAQITQEHKEAVERENNYLAQVNLLNKTVQEQASQLSKIAMYWRLLCDKDCNTRHVPTCPLKDNTEAKS